MGIWLLSATKQGDPFNREKIGTFPLALSRIVYQPTKVFCEKAASTFYFHHSGHMLSRTRSEHEIFIPCDILVTDQKEKKIIPKV